MNDLRYPIVRAVEEFLERDSCLLEIAAHEQAISHRIAVYLEQFFGKSSGLNVDCEYNKHLNAPKTGSFDAGYFQELRLKLNKCVCWPCTHPTPENFHEKLFRPDILVHSRGNDDANLIVIEIKRDVICPFDLTKLKALATPKTNGGEYGYQVGLFLHFPDGQPAYEWF